MSDQQLSIMHESVVIETRREGIKIYYKIANPKTLQACLIIRIAMIDQMTRNMNFVIKV